MITYNLATAKNVVLERILPVRKSALSSLDVQYMKAQESSDTATMSAVAAKKQLIRDLPTRVNAVTTFEDLTALTYPELTV